MGIAARHVTWHFWGPDLDYNHMIIQHLQPLFWDVNHKDFSPPSHPEYTIARILEYGDEKAIAWLTDTFLEDDIKKVVCAERRLSRRSANFWALVYRIPPVQVAALQSGR